MANEVPKDEQLELIAGFCERSAVEGTRRAYKRVVRELFQFIGDCSLSDVTSAQINAWRDSLMEHNQPSTVLYKLIIIWTLFEFLQAIGVVDKNPAAKKDVPLPPPQEFMSGRALASEEV